jgi:KDO2-lipid IV(A) lauroyltransferase
MWLLALLSRFACALPEHWVAAWGRAVGWLLFAARVRRRVLSNNLEGALGLRGRPAAQLARRIYRHMGSLLVEYLRLPRLLCGRRAHALMGEENLARLSEYCASGRGVVVVSAHLGNWDLLACAAAACGLPVNVVTRELKPSWLQRFWYATRGGYGVRQISATGSSREILAALSRGEIVALVLDQHQPQGAKVSFFSAPAATSTAAARLHKMTKAPIVPAFLVRANSGYALRLGDEIQGTSILDVTQKCSSAIEHAVREHPEQWFWVHRRWKINPNWPRDFVQPLGRSEHHIGKGSVQRTEGRSKP